MSPQNFHDLGTCLLLLTGTAALFLYLYREPYGCQPQTQKKGKK